MACDDGVLTIAACGHPDVESEPCMADFTRRGVLVTGASGGIGAATVRRLASQGATVYAGGRDSQQLTKLGAETGARPVPFDLTSEDEIQAAVSGLDLWGVVNCGGFGGGVARPQENRFAGFDKVCSAHRRGSPLVLKNAPPRVVEPGGGGSEHQVSTQTG